MPPPGPLPPEEAAATMAGYISTEQYLWGCSASSTGSNRRRET
jgi:hypothetical protein